MAAARMKGYGRLAVAGGVAANSRIRADPASRLRQERGQALPAGAEVLRRQRRHDRLPGIL